jgi:hypothetical protein
MYALWLSAKKARKGATQEMDFPKLISDGSSKRRMSELKRVVFSHFNPCFQASQSLRLDDGLTSQLTSPRNPFEQSICLEGPTLIGSRTLVTDEINGFYHTLAQFAGTI